MKTATWVAKARRLWCHKYGKKHAADELKIRAIDPCQMAAGVTITKPINSQQKCYLSAEAKQK